MAAIDLTILENDNIPEAAKVAYIEAEGKRTEPSLLKIESRKLWIGIPVVVAAIGAISAIVTASINYWQTDNSNSSTLTLQQLKQQFELFDNNLKRQNVVALEELKQEFAVFNSRQKQILSEKSNFSDAEITAKADERRFQYKIVESELASKKTSAERAAVLLFLVRAGVLSSLNEAELRKMAESALPKNSETISEIPALSLGKSSVYERPLGYDRIIFTSIDIKISYIERVMNKENNIKKFKKSGLYNKFISIKSYYEEEKKKFYAISSFLFERKIRPVDPYDGFVIKPNKDGTIPELGGNFAKLLGKPTIEGFSVGGPINNNISIFENILSQIEIIYEFAKSLQ